MEYAAVQQQLKYNIIFRGAYSLVNSQAKTKGAIFFIEHNSYTRQFEGAFQAFGVLKELGTDFKC